MSQSAAPIAPPSPPRHDDGARTASHGRLLAEVALASRVVATARPLDRFVGLNPLSGLEDLGFGQAVDVAGRALGAQGTPDEATLRAAHDAGRITTAQLHAAVCALAPGVRDEVVQIDGAAVSAVELLVDDLLNGPRDGRPGRRTRTLAEALAPRLAAQIDRRTARWCAAYCDAGQAAWAMPNRDLGLYRAWRSIGAHEPGMPRELRRALRRAPDDAAEAVLGALAELGVPDRELREYLESHLTALPGWAAHFRYREQEGTGDGLIDLLAVRIVQEAALLGSGVWLPSLVSPVVATGAVSTRDRAALLLARWGHGTSRTDDVEAVADVLATLRGRRGLAWLEAYEAGYRSTLLRALDRQGAGPVLAAPAAQLVCCIDARSEGLRRHFEALGDYDTYGFAGFFGVPLHWQPLGAGEPIAHCPVPVEPSVAATERVRAADADEAERAGGGRRRLHGLRAALHEAHAGAAGAFTLAEFLGMPAGPLAAARTVAPERVARAEHRIRAALAPAAATGAELPLLDPRGRIELAERILRGIGLVERLAPIVVICAHESHTTNNPFASALDCGACGGHSGRPNAKVVAALLNDPAVRAGLAEAGLTVPASTWFVAAVHETTTDAIAIEDADLVPKAFAEPLSLVRADLERAGRALAEERAAVLPASDGESPAARSADWAQVFPEWGLAGCAALIVAPRARTHGVDLGRRTFLHSYDAALDPDGSVLELILTAPMVVAHGLSAQYYAAASDPLRHGSGTKAVHNVVGGVGVTAAAGGDLLTGLPWQSVADGDRLVHEPMRLLVLVEAPRDRVADILARHEGVRRLVDGEWLRLLVREHPGDPWTRRLADAWHNELPDEPLDHSLPLAHSTTQGA
jgi:uncharacterized protein YbcC (UPF0753/DUF2309 family)